MSSTGDAGRVDFSFLDRLAAGDQGLMREVLEIFLEESVGWRTRLGDGQGPEAAEVIHTLKGSGRAVGAHALGDLCEDWEMGEFEEVSGILGELDAVEAEIRTWLAR